jgi:hypothetical protein
MLAWIWRKNSPIPNDVFRLLHGYLTHPIPKERPVEQYEGKQDAFLALQNGGKIPPYLDFNMLKEACYWSEYIWVVLDVDRVATRIAFTYWMTVYPEEYEKYLNRTYPDDAYRAMIRRLNHNEQIGWRNKPLICTYKYTHLLF